MNHSTIRVKTASRLHFGLLALPGVSTGSDNLPARYFGGVGLMIENPGISLTLEPKSDWSAHGPCSERALAIAKQFGAALRIQQAFQIQVDHCSAEHIGLGTGTQLSLAVARAIALTTNHEELSALDVARLTGRGLRSAIGIHGFEHGGFLVEAGKRDPQVISPLISRVNFPEYWSILLVIPRGFVGDHGQRELEAFETLTGTKPNLEKTDRMCRLVLLGMLPALIEHDLPAFGEAIYDFNRSAGEMYRCVQGEIYSHPHIAEMVSLLRENGVTATGQSSWGPTVFGIADSEKAKRAYDMLKRRLSPNSHEVLLTSAANRGARASVSSSPPFGEKG